MDQTALDEKLRKLRQALTRKRSRAVDSGNEQKKWETDFDIERLAKGLIDPCERAPFIDCLTSEEHLHTARIFAFAFRHAGEECPDIQPDETVDRFIFRVHKLWYRKPVGEVLFFVGLRTLRFDDDLGVRRPEFDFDSEWEVLSAHDVTVDVAALAPIGKEPVIPEWKNRILLEASLRTKAEIDRDLTPSSKTETEVPQLRYQGIITEH